MIHLRLKSSKTGKYDSLVTVILLKFGKGLYGSQAFRLCTVKAFLQGQKLHTGLALPTGAESDCEYIDIQIDNSKETQLQVEEICTSIKSNLPPGIQINGASVMEGKFPSLQQTVTSCIWDITVNEDDTTVDSWLDRIESENEIVLRRERKGKEVVDDIKPLVHLVRRKNKKIDGRVTVQAELGTQPRSLRPSELLRSMEPSPE